MDNQEGPKQETLRPHEIAKPEYVQALESNVEAWGEGSKVIALIEGGNVEEAMSHLRFLKRTGDAVGALQVIILYAAKKTNKWQELGYPTFEAFATAETGKGESTIHEMMRNLAYFIDKGRSLHEFYRYSAKLGWSILREVRTFDVPGERLTEALDTIVSKQLARSAVRRFLESLSLPPTDETAKGGDGKDDVFKEFAISLPNKVLKNFRSVLQHVKKTQHVKGDAQAVECLATLYFTHLATLDAE